MRGDIDSGRAIWHRRLVGWVQDGKDELEQIT